ncbi:Na+/H+ antiporter NhaC [Ligilactobacillus sp. WILCCON 0076]|uniref:Na+/H+ antiporter NhaC n=1 Tax=Ligilactobacillus ubinensis TaxID=2876789 RepID=A0A9X2FFU0_9LACO|nr:Na+/H+ antiporter NhaC [Ligilactobacillus ubinensis]MCP0885752.1 Na+/H+ antiporter NhaC [Ligilactobacillus ubinensis]
MKKEQSNQPSLREASLVLLIIISSIAVSIIWAKLTADTAILFAIGITIVYAIIKKVPFNQIHEGIIEGLSPGIIPIFIFILVGVLIATWIQAGIIPTLMVWGFKIISVKWFVPSAFIVCAIVGSAVGSAFTVMSTVGVALFGIGSTLGLNPALLVGAIVSGSVFGDKTSPLSESTNLTAAVVDADLFDHIKNLMWSTVPAFVVSVILFAFLGMTNKNSSLSSISKVTNILQANFHISFLSIIPLLLMFVCAWRHLPAIITIMLNIGLAILMIFLQNPNTKISYIGQIVESGVTAHTGNKQIDLLLSRGGIESMMPTVALIILTLSLGGLLIKTQLISTVMNRAAKKLTKTPSLILATMLSGIGVNIFIGEQFLSVILPGNAFKKVYEKAGLAPVVLGRVLEDSGTVINYLIPWGVAGSFVAGTFGVATFSYLPFVFFSLLSPVFSLLSGFTGIGIKKITPRKSGVTGK